MSTSLKVQLSTLQFLQFFVWGIWYVTAGTYFIQTLGFSGREVAVIYSSFAIAATITPLFLGALADNYFAVEKMLAFLHIIGAGLLLAVPSLLSFKYLYPVLFIYVLLYVPTIGLSSSICFHSINNAKKNYPPIRVWGTIGWIVAGVLASFLNIEDKVTPFYISCLGSLVLGVFCFFLPHTPPQKSGVSFLQSLKDPELVELLRSRSLQILIVSIGLISIPLAYYYTFVNPFLNEFGMEYAASKMTIGQGMEIVAMLLLPWFFKNMKFKYIVFIGLLLWGLRYGMFIIGADYNMEWVLILALLVHGIAFTFGILAVQIYFDEVIPIHLRSTAQGLFSFLTMGLMGLVGTYIAGEFVTANTLADGTHIWRNIWALPSIIGIVVAFVFLFTFKKEVASKR